MMKIKYFLPSNQIFEQWFSYNIPGTIIMQGYILNAYFFKMEEKIAQRKMQDVKKDANGGVELEADYCVYYLSSI